MKILMVCLGNICRSPLAEGILQHKITQNKLNWEVDSAGTGYWHAGEPPDPRSVEIARDNGIDISSQRARQFKPLDFDRFDLIFAMDSSNYQNILQHARSDSDKEKVQLFLNMIDPGRNQNVPDPYYGAENGFKEVFQLLENACDKLLEKYS